MKFSEQHINGKLLKNIANNLEGNDLLDLPDIAGFKDQPMSEIIKELRRDWTNNFYSPEGYGDFYDLTESEAKTLTRRLVEIDNAQEGTSMTLDIYRLFKDYKEAYAEGLETFIVNDREIVTGYAHYLLEHYLNERPNEDISRKIKEQLDKEATHV